MGERMFRTEEYAQQMFRCEPLHGSHTVAQCRANRKMLVLRPGQCAPDCALAALVEAGKVTTWPMEDIKVKSPPPPTRQFRKERLPAGSPMVGVGVEEIDERLSDLRGDFDALLVEHMDLEA